MVKYFVIMYLSFQVRNKDFKLISGKQRLLLKTYLKL